MIEARKGGVEFLTGIFGKARAVTRDEAVLAAPPFAENIDRVIELCRADRRQKTGLQGLGDKAIAGRCNGRFLRRVEGLGTHPPPFTFRHWHLLSLDAARLCTPAVSSAPYSHSIILSHDNALIYRRKFFPRTVKSRHPIRQKSQLLI